MSDRAGESALLRIEDLAVSFDNGRGPRLRAVDGATVSVYPEQLVAVVGESGCGKSVTAMSVLRLIPSPPGRFDRGRIEYETGERLGWGRVNLLELDERRMREIRGNEIAMIFQEPMTSLNPVFTVGDQLCEAIRLHQSVPGREARRIAVQALSDVGIPDPGSRLDAYPHEFSGGMRQRVMIAMALACEPRVLLADEPTTALDVTVQAQILELLGELRTRRGLGVLLITHDLGVVAENADVVCVMYAGSVVEYAPVRSLFEHPRHPYTRGLLACIPVMGERRDRLVTTGEIVDDPGQFTEIGGERPWWPWHDAPSSAMTRVLREVSPDHWVGVWAEPGHEGPGPSIDSRRSAVRG